MESCTLENNRKEKRQNKIAKLIVLIVCTLIGICLVYVIAVFLFLRIFVFPTRTVKVLISPDNTHKAVLKRLDGIDLIFFVIVDGRKVYSSPDFAPNQEIGNRLSF